MKEFFEQNRQKFDVSEPHPGHQERFLQKLQEKKSATIKPIGYSGYKKWIMAASVALLFGLIFQTGRIVQQKKTENIQIQQNEQYFSMIIQKELEEVQQETSPETEKIFNDAMEQIKLLENDYQQLIKDYRQNKDKFILNAMINNFRQRIDILQSVKHQIKEIKNAKKYHDENHTA